jgi:hypothetical protein
MQIAVEPSRRLASICKGKVLAPGGGIPFHWDKKGNKRDGEFRILVCRDKPGYWIWPPSLTTKYCILHSKQD